MYYTHNHCGKFRLLYSMACITFGDMDRQLKQFPGYTVSMSGEVKKDGKALPQHIRNVNGHRYHAVCLPFGNEYNSVGKPVYVHRLVALTWLETPEQGKTIVSHRDGNTLNNKAFNLVWISRAEVQRKDNGRAGKTHTAEAKRKISAANKGAKNPRSNGQYICNYKSYPTATEAAKRLKMSVRGVILKCKTPKNKAQGWYFVPSDRETELKPTP